LTAVYPPSIRHLGEEQQPAPAGRAQIRLPRRERLAATRVGDRDPKPGSRRPDREVDAIERADICMADAVRHDLRSQQEHVIEYFLREIVEVRSQITTGRRGRGPIRDQ
jgi:hypothetical protein